MPHLFGNEGKLPSNPPLTGSLRVAHLDNSLDFIALSWLCALGTTKNCYDALKQIRCSLGSGAERISIWVDSICIDQNNNHEKEVQIPLMQEIYRFASEVVMWLGEGNNKTDRAMLYMQDVARQGQRLPLGYLAARDQKGRLQQKAKLEAEMGKDTWVGMVPLWRWRRQRNMAGVQLEEILDCEWTHCAWTFQELILARHPIMMCATKMMDWDDWRNDFMAWLSLNGSNHPVSPRVLKYWTHPIDLWFGFLRTDDFQPHEMSRDMGPILPNENLTSFNARFRAAPKRPALRFYQTYPFLWILLFLIISCGLLKVCLFAIQLWNPVSVVVIVRRITLTFAIGGVIAVKCTQVMEQALDLEDSHTPWFMKSKDINLEFSKSRTLDSIRSALRERSATEACDKAFSLHGIIKACGTKTSAPDYSRPASEAYRLLLEALIQWGPRAIMLVLDAGGQKQGASWVPDSTKPGPSEWLTTRYQLTPDDGSTPTLTSCPWWGIFTPKSNLIHLKSPLVCIKGIIVGHPSKLTPSDWFEQGLESSIRIFLNWHQKGIHSYNIQVQRDGDTVLRYQFAVLEGLVRHRRELIGRTTMEELLNIPCKRPRKPWEAPLDFSDRVSDFKTYCRLWDLIQTTQQLEQLMEQIKRVEYKIEWDCMVKTIKQLGRDRRNLFVMSGLNYTTTMCRWLGSGPVDMQPNDKISMFEGIPTPMVLRHAHQAKYTNEYRVVGVVLVRGFMDGRINRHDGPVCPRWADCQDVLLV
ncbi:heterokaryon incompatibility protein-domain-containing protein [Podospora fimiseda]|uniref:Heterokaryon incompatibility protein-domain-containing protein n=1 Tax=Podospora fimiseda TaxID=252190 RepID=A0AAN6YPV2_9PEZI|nr:heterokaryon incompatibility protein-domain-containing protein [Podospora fimiseda]